MNPSLRAAPRRLLGSKSRAVRASIATAALLLWTALSAELPIEAEGLCPSPYTVGGTLAASATGLTSDFRLYQAGFSTTDWSGDLRAFKVDANGEPESSPQWSANDGLPAADLRRIFSSSAPTTGIPFTAADLSTAGLGGRFGTDPADIEAMVNYLRGDQSNEIANGGTLRTRGARLGAIVNSDIVLASQQDFGYEALFDAGNPGSPASLAGAAYPQYLQTKINRPKLLLVGANDGMLHGFDAGTGVETFAFVPRTLVNEPVEAGVDDRSTLVRLAGNDFRRYFVDGSPWVGDAYWGTAWRTVVVGTTGAGGKGVFALNITDPANMTETAVLWDFDGRGDANMGYPFGQPVIGRLADNHFYAIFGNGGDSANQCPVLYLVRLHDGVVRRIATGGRSLADSCAAEPNGLGRPSLFDVQSPGAVGYRTTDYVYAGDLRGNLWRFDLRSVNLDNDPPTGAAVQLLFTASDSDGQFQPITGAIEIGALPSGVTSPAAMLWFGTGRYFRAGDIADTTVQSMYGMVDRFSIGGDANTAKISRGNLLGRTLNVGVGDSGTIDTQGVNDVPYTGDDTTRRDGWFIDFRTGERMVSLPMIQRGRLFFTTVIPETGSGCIGAGSSSIYAVDPYHGRAPVQTVFINHSGLHFIGSTAGVLRSLVYVDTRPQAFLYGGGMGDSTGKTIQFEKIEPLQQAGARGRVSWREIVR